LIVNRTNAVHYGWGDACDGWVLSPGPDMMAIEEQMPPHVAEKRHHHQHARQIFYVLEGTFTMELNGTVHELAPGDSIEIAPGSKHQARDDSDLPGRFLVVSSPSTRGDRVDAQ
jgi:quercetin dioxygenase-like cupin family protein